MKAFKVCGLLAEDLMDEASSNFLPGDLGSEKNLLKLIPEASLGREQLIFSGGMWNAEEDTGEKGLKMLRNVGNALGLGK